jgi:carbamoyl-phosphate synthase large subunit
LATDSNEYFLNLAITDARYLVPRAKDPAYIDKLNDIIHKENIAFLHAQPDIEVEVVSENREKLGAPVYLPSKAAVKSCQDKLQSAEVWKQKDVPVARTLEVLGDKDIERAFEEFGSPIWLGQGLGQAVKAGTPARVETAVNWICIGECGVDWDLVRRSFCQEETKRT